MAADSHRASAAARVLIILSTGAAWSRGILRGFMGAAHERGWTLLHYHPPANLDWLAHEFEPSAVVVGPELAAEALTQFFPAPIVSVTFDRSGEGLASVCPDDVSVAAMALQHLLATGLRQVTTFRFDGSPFAITRERAFVECAVAAGVQVAQRWGEDLAEPLRREEVPVRIVSWLRALPKPCGVFTLTDSWGRVVTRYASMAGIRVPEDLALIGADNDVLECELIAPPLSSVIIPWKEIGKNAAKLVQLALSGQSIAGKRLTVDPIGVLRRRSSDILAIQDPLVAQAVRWIREHAGGRMNVPMVARAVGSARQRLERRFRGVLDRTVLEEIRRARVDIAKGLLETTRAPLSEIARRSGFTNAALLSGAFHRELGIPPGVYRRRVQRALDGTGEDDAAAPDPIVGAVLSSLRDAGRAQNAPPH